MLLLCRPMDHRIAGLDFSHDHKQIPGKPYLRRRLKLPHLELFLRQKDPEDSHDPWEGTLESITVSQNKMK